MLVHKTYYSALILFNWGTTPLYQKQDRPCCDESRPSQAQHEIETKTGNSYFGEL